VVSAGDGEEALEIIKQRPPDFISLDLIMPRKSGHRLLYELRKNKQWSRIPVLIVTAHARDELGEGELKDLLDNRVMSGPGTYLEKPVNPLTYVRSVQRALGIEETPETADRIGLREELHKSMQGASPEALRKALEALKKKPSD
jgi:CheY-like chemotaxis protein